jgi:hypothetical protein
MQSIILYKLTKLTGAMHIGQTQISHGAQPRSIHAGLFRYQGILRGPVVDQEWV